MMNNNLDGEIQIKIVIKGKTKEIFEKLKEYYNLGYNAEVIGLLIKKVYDKKIKYNNQLQ